jgi:hypothetical protein
MARDDAVTKPHILRRLGFSQQLKFRSALSVKPHPHKIVQYWHGRSRPIADTQESEIYVKNRRCALTFPTYPHVSTGAASPLSLGALAALDEGEKSESASSQARGRRGLGPLIWPPCLSKQHNALVQYENDNCRDQREKKVPDNLFLGGLIFEMKRHGTLPPRPRTTIYHIVDGARRPCASQAASDL